MPSPTIFGFDFRYSKPAVDDTDITDGQAVGVHVRGTGGDVGLAFADPDESGAEVTDILYIEQGGYLKVPIKRLISANTTANNVHILYGKLRTRVPPA